MIKTGDKARLISKPQRLTVNGFSIGDTVEVIDTEVDGHHKIRIAFYEGTEIKASLFGYCDFENLELIEEVN